jgi:O-antigen ligase
MARERPWIGFGLGSFQEVYPAYATFDIGLIVNHAHNDWAEWLAEGGVPFLLLLASVALWSVGPAFRSIWGLGLLSVFLHALVDYPMQRLGLAAWVFVMLGTLAAEERDRSRAIRAAAAPTLF